jgi:hypothetical protein
MNLFLAADGSVRLGDLGVARQLSPSTAVAHTVIGTPYYLSPELCNGQPYGVKADVSGAPFDTLGWKAGRGDVHQYFVGGMWGPPAIAVNGEYTPLPPHKSASHRTFDPQVWALGVVLYELLTAGQLPFTASNQAALVLRILRGEYAPPLSDIGYSRLLLSTLAACLAVKVEERPTTAQLLMVYEELRAPKLVQTNGRGCGGGKNASLVVEEEERPTTAQLLMFYEELRDSKGRAASNTWPVGTGEAGAEMGSGHGHASDRGIASIGELSIVGRGRVGEGDAASEGGTTASHSRHLCDRGIASDRRHASERGRVGEVDAASEGGTAGDKSHASDRGTASNSWPVGTGEASAEIGRGHASDRGLARDGGRVGLGGASAEVDDEGAFDGNDAGGAQSSGGCSGRGSEGGGGEGGARCLGGAWGGARAAGDAGCGAEDSDGGGRAVGGGDGAGCGTGEGGDAETISMLPTRGPIPGSPLYRALQRDGAATTRGVAGKARGRGGGGARGRGARSGGARALGPPADQPVTFRAIIRSSGYGIPPAVSRMHVGGPATLASRARTRAATAPVLGRHAGAALARRYTGGDDPPVVPQPESTGAVAPLGAAQLRSAFAPDASRLVLGGADGSVTLLRLPARRHPTHRASPPTLCAHERVAIRSVEWSASGRLLLSASADGSACLWDVEGSRTPASPLLHMTHTHRPPPMLQAGILGLGGGGAAVAAAGAGGADGNAPFKGDVWQVCTLYVFHPSRFAYSIEQTPPAPQHPPHHPRPLALLSTNFGLF